MDLPPAFREMLIELENAGIAYMLTGSFATAFYGHPRSTQDIDLVISATPAQLQALFSNLSGDDYYADLDSALQALKRESMFNIVDLRSGWKIDLIVRKSRAFSVAEFSRRYPASVAGHTIYVATSEDLVIAKLEWSKLSHSQRQLEDAAGILRIRQDLTDTEYLEKWVRELSLEQQWRAARSIAERK